MALQSPVPTWLLARAASGAEGFKVLRLAAPLGDGRCRRARALSPCHVPRRRTVQDKMTGADIKLTDEQVDLVQRLQKGQFGDVHFDPYEVRLRHALGLPGAGPVLRAAATRPCVSPAGR